MPRRTRVATGIYHDAYGYEVRVWWRGQVRQRRYPPRTPVRTMEDWQIATRRALEDADPLGDPQAFREAARTYLHSDAFTALVSKKDRKRDVEGWVALFGDTPVVMVTPQDAQQHLTRWQQEGYAPTTINHRLDALTAIVPALRGHLVRLAPPRRRLRYVPRERLVRVLEALRPGLTSSRCWWLYWTGMRPSQLMRVTEQDVDWEAGFVAVPAGKGGENYLVPLLPEAVTQLKALTRATTLGHPWSVSAADKVLKHTCLRMNVPPITVYAFRRSFGQTLRAEADLDDVRELMGHRSSSTTAHYAPAIPEKLARAVKALRVVDRTGQSRGPMPLGD